MLPVAAGLCNLEFFYLAMKMDSKLLLKSSSNSVSGGLDKLFFYYYKFSVLLSSP